MYSKNIVLVFCAFASAPAFSQWKYSNVTAGIDEITYKSATATATESLNLDFPYGGQNLASVRVRTNPKGWDVIFHVQKGQLICHQTCQVKIKVDDKPSRLVSMVRAADSGVSNMLFVQNSGQAQALARELVSATKLAAELPIYKAMNTVVRFEVSGLDLSELGVISTSTSGSAAPTADKLVQDLQTALNQRGFNAGPADGFIGPQTQTAIITAQRALGITANGLPSETLLTALRKGSTTISQEEPAFNQSLATFRKGEYKVAIENITAFIAIYPDSKFIPLAKFYLGSSQYATRDFRGAINTLEGVVKQYPNSPRTADALLLIAGCQVELNNRPGAKATLQYIIQQYAGTTAADTAIKRLPLL